MRLSLLFKILAALIFLAIPASADENSPQKEWSYDDDYDGQEDWGAIKGYEICRYGFAQSPINIAYTKTTKLPELKFKSSKVKATLEATNKALAAKISNAQPLIYDNKSYSLQTVEFHSPGSHRIRGKYYPFEINIIYKAPDDRLLIIAVLGLVKDSNQAMEAILNKANSKSTAEFSFDLHDFMPKNRGYFLYKGSLPYPPCTENVDWIVMKDSAYISHEQLINMGEIVGRNTRLLQPLYIREVQETAE